MKHILKFTPSPTDGIGKWADGPTGPYFLCNLGNEWPHRPERRLISRTSLDPAEARQFDSEEEANATLVVAGSPKGWEVVPV